MKNNHLKKKLLLFEISCILSYLILVDKLYKHEKKIFDSNKDHDYVHVRNMSINKLY